MDAIKSFVNTHTKEICITAVVGVALITCTVTRSRRGKRQNVTSVVYYVIVYIGVVWYPVKKGIKADELERSAVGEGELEREHLAVGEGELEREQGREYLAAEADSDRAIGCNLDNVINVRWVPVDIFSMLQYLKNEHDSIPSSKNKVTWIECDGEEIADSEFCIQYVNNKFNVDLDKGFSDGDRGAALAIQRMVDEHLYWTLALQRWVYDPKDGIDVGKHLNFSWIVPPIVGRKVSKQSYAQGVGRHTEVEVHHVMHEDLKALSMFIGNKKFLLGDNVCQADCSVFGMLTQLYWHGFGGYMEKAIQKYPNLCAYCERMKAEFWPDWDDCITHGGTRTATK